MTQLLKPGWKKIVSGFIFLFFILFVFRLIYGFTITVEGPSGTTQFLESIANTRRNYASKEYKVKTQSNNQPAQSVDQKYEKIAEINTKSTKFESEEKAVRQKIDRYQSLIQFEQKTGNDGYRKLHLLIGVPPENFDSLYAQLTTIGKIQAKQITKKDKTNEYKELNARKLSLDKIRNSLIDLKSKGGQIEEYINLENRILDIEQQLQGLGVSLGDFDNENEFCTVKFSMFEGKEVKISFLHRIKVALEWTVKIYLGMMTSLFFIGLFAYIVLAIIEKLRIFGNR